MGFLRGAAFLSVFLSLCPWSLPAEETAPEEKPNVCISCHRDLGGPMAEPVTLWEKSIHRQMGNSCEGCHGGDPSDPAEAMNPAKGFVGAPRPEGIPDFCGKCHVGVVENYKKSPHYAAFVGGSGPSCVTCHESHGVQRASFDLISPELCSRCHSYDNGQKIKKAFVSAEMALHGMSGELHNLDKRGMPVKKLEEKFFAERNSLHQMTHSLDVGEIEARTRSVLADIETMEKETSALGRRIHRRWWIGAGVALFLTVLISLLIRLLKSFEEEQE